MVLTPGELAKIAAQLLFYGGVCGGIGAVLGYLARRARTPRPPPAVPEVHHQRADQPRRKAS